MSYNVAFIDIHNHMLRIHLSILRSMVKYGNREQLCKKRRKGFLAKEKNTEEKTIREKRMKVAYWEEAGSRKRFLKGEMMQGEKNNIF